MADTVGAGILIGQPFGEVICMSAISRREARKWRLRVIREEDRVE